FFITLKIHDFPTDISIPGLGVSWDLGWGYGLLIIFMLVGASNAVNLTDGLDGLLAGTASAAFGAFALLAFYIQSEVDIITMFALMIDGTIVRFIVFKTHQDKVFMLDIGSLVL